MIGGSTENKKARGRRSIKAEDIRNVVLPYKTKSHPHIKSGGVTLTAHVSNRVPEDLLLNAADMRDMLEIMTSNALNNTESGRVHIHIDIDLGDELSILNIIVADTGRGIAPAKLDEIERELMIQKDIGLYPDPTRDASGLTRLFKILNACDADLEINTNVGHGTEFIVTFPVKQAREEKLSQNEELIELEEMWRSGPEPEIPATKPIDPPAKPTAEADVFAPETPSPIADFEANTRQGFSRRRARDADPNETNISFSNMRILVVEDIIANQEVLRSLLEPAGCIVSTADNGKEAVDIAGVQTFDAILMDIRMPIMNGVIATEYIRRADTPNRDVPIIALTADASEENNAHCLAAGADVFLTKPVVISELFSAIRYACSQRERRDRNTEPEQLASA